MTQETLSPMQQELLSRADAIFASVGKSIETAVDFGKEQLPDIAYQYLAFSRAYISLASIIEFIIMIIGLWLIINVGIRDTRKLGMDKWNADWVASRYSIVIFGFFIALISMIMFFSNLKPLLLVWLAPKIFLIQGMVELVKGKV